MAKTALAVLIAVISASAVGAQRSRAIVEPCTLPVGDRMQIWFSFQVERPAVFVSQPRRSPRPTVSTAASAVVLQFVVDTMGRVERTTMRALRVRDSTLLADALLAAPQWRFRPAWRDSCYPVRQLVNAAVVR